MSENLSTLVAEELLPLLVHHRFQLVHSEASDAFDNANVVLESPVLRLRVLRERGIVFADLGPSTEPNTWFDSAVIVDYLGLSSTSGFHGEDARSVLRGIGGFVNAMWNDLQSKFSEQRLATTKRELQILKDQRAAKQFAR